jgi:hypothetical protein
MELSSSNAASLTPPSNLSIGNAPALSTASLTNFSKEQIKELYSASGDFNELKRQGLVVLVQGVLEPLVNWCNEKMDERVLIILHQTSATAQSDFILASYF